MPIRIFISIEKTKHTTTNPRRGFIDRQRIIKFFDLVSMPHGSTGTVVNLDRVDCPAGVARQGEPLTPLYVR
ncbi:hypothetical protein, partial [Bacteroides sp. 519]|uniref:hypothetical protein n=1 Tax=Bacteroides sp. 519 TaxID=2302937 RepID=UPI0019403086